MPISDRRSLVKTNKLCFNCIHPDHMVDACTVAERCRYCSQAHHSLLHVSSSDSTSNASPKVSHPNKPTSPSSSSSSPPSSSSSLFSTSLLLSKPSESFVYLATALVNVIDFNGHPTVARALLDSGSQINFISESFLAKLRIQTTPLNSSVLGLGSHPISIKQCATIQIVSRTSKYAVSAQVQAISSITAYQPSSRVTNTSNWGIPKNMCLADPKFGKLKPIDLLLGAEIYSQLLSVGQIRLSDDLPILQNTLFGWIVSGKLTFSESKSPVCHVVSELEDDCLKDVIERFWTIENLPHSEKPRSQEEAECEQHFIENTKRDKDGRFVVKLPFSADPSTLGDSKFAACRRFYNLERRLQHNPELMAAYSSFIEEYQSLDHMRLVPSSEIEHPNFYLPHHCVVKPDSSTTKLRVVFDGSAKTSSGSSLNSILQVGPTVQNELFSILIRFRAHKYAFSADISKMYRQILVHEDDQRFQYILWRTNPSHDLHTFKLKTVTYGTSSAPYLATRCLKQLAVEQRQIFPTAADVIEKDIYVDCLLTGNSVVEKAFQLKFKIVNILKSGRMDLRK